MNADLIHMIDELRYRGLHEIMFRNAGVGLLFYEGDYDAHGFPVGSGKDDTWKEHLKVKRYYPTFLEAVEAEYRERVLT